MADSTIIDAINTIMRNIPNAVRSAQTLPPFPEYIPSWKNSAASSGVSQGIASSGANRRPMIAGGDFYYDEPRRDYPQPNGFAEFMLGPTPGGPNLLENLQRIYGSPKTGNNARSLFSNEDFGLANIMLGALPGNGVLHPESSRDRYSGRRGNRHADNPNDREQ